MSAKTDTDQVENQGENSLQSPESKHHIVTSNIHPVSKRTPLKEDLDPNYSLKGNTLRVYMHILRTKGNDPIGIREIQRELKLSSATLAKYHLEKLREMFLLAQNEDGSYSLLKEVKIDVLKPFMTLGSFIIPRLFTYAVMVSILFVYLVLFVLPAQNLAEIAFFSVAVGEVSLFAMWYETLRSWRSTPH